ncbi:MAG: alpha-E domain-containing protein [Gammaproteobacteria bacterium]|nr:alpha-E domain-containing protein [Gammaproteobacteria bacterium]NNF66226.1 alpha-E domain-containing protein [Gammaproteobacteria bacterium]
MLSRAAERVYWTGRYLERAENTARIVQQYSQLLLDLPDEVGVEWVELVRVVGAADAFAASGLSPTRDTVLNFLLAETEGHSSLAYALKMARENVRITRDLLPHESWENVNELYQHTRKTLGTAATGEDRFEVLSDCIGRCQQINGSLMGTMSHHSPFHFLLLGQCIERADMTSRIVDVAAAYIQHNERLVRRYGSSLWTNVLKSVSGFQMYRQYCQPQVEGYRVIQFLLRDRAFPRAVTWCIEQAKTSSGALPRGKNTIAALDHAEALLRPMPTDRLTASDVSALMDGLQTRLNDAHSTVADTWFLSGEDT